MKELKFEKSQFKVNVYGTSQELRGASNEEYFGYTDKLKKLIKEDGDDREYLSAAIKHIVSLGMTKEVAESMEWTHISELIEVIHSAKK